MLDITHTPDGDVELEVGDLAYSESTGQHQKDILLSDKGYYKENPNIGIGTINFVNDNSPENFLRTVRKEFTRDGMKVQRVKMVEGKLIIDAEYENSKG